MTVELNYVVIGMIKAQLDQYKSDELDSVRQMFNSGGCTDNLGLAVSVVRAQHRREGAERILREMGISVEWSEGWTSTLIYKGEEVKA